MVIEKDKKLINKFYTSYKKNCRICNKPITSVDIENKEFEYVKSKLSENFFHTACINHIIEN